MSDREEFVNWMIEKGLYGWPRKPYNVQELVEASYQKGLAASAKNAESALPYGAISAYNEAKDGCAEFRNMEIPCRLVAEMVEALLPGDQEPQQ